MSMVEFEWGRLNHSGKLTVNLLRILRLIHFDEFEKEEEKYVIIKPGYLSVVELIYNMHVQLYFNYTTNWATQANKQINVRQLITKLRHSPIKAKIKCLLYILVKSVNIESRSPQVLSPFS